MFTKSTLKENPGMLLFVTYLTLLVVNMLVVYLASMWFPQNVVLGTAHLSTFGALFLSMNFLALLGTFAIPFIREYERMKKKMLSNTHWMIKYFALNFVGLWVIARFAEQLGLGLSSWMVAAVLAVALDVFQGVAMMQLEKMRK